MLPYFPAYTTLTKIFGVDLSTLDESSKVEVKVGVLKMLLRSALATAPYNEDSYKALNPDLKAAWEEGKVEDLHKHYIENGYFEGRNAAALEFDEEWYLSYYKDVALAVREGAINSAQEHYEKAGEREWRAPNSASSIVLQGWRAVSVSNS